MKKCKNSLEDFFIKMNTFLYMLSDFIMFWCFGGWRGQYWTNWFWLSPELNWIWGEHEKLIKLNININNELLRKEEFAIFVISETRALAKIY